LDLERRCRVPAGLRAEHVRLLIEREVQRGGRRADRRDVRGLWDTTRRNSVEEPPEGERLRELLLRSRRARHLMRGGHARQGEYEPSILGLERQLRSPPLEERIHVSRYPYEEDRESHRREEAPAASHRVGGNPEGWQRESNEHVEVAARTGKLR